MKALRAVFAIGAAATGVAAQGCSAFTDCFSCVAHPCGWCYDWEFKTDSFCSDNSAPCPLPRWDYFIGNCPYSQTPTQAPTPAPTPSASTTASTAQSATTAATLVLDGTTALHRYDGHGALSAGASSRLLWDYPEPYRSDVLDYLFKPQFGAGLQMLKVEIGGDGQSTDGTEPSHKHSRDDLSCTRGYELWLIEQAKARNPAIQTYGLSWAAPAWVGNGTYYSADNVAYQVAWLECIRSAAGVAVDFLGLWNEKPQPGPDYVLALRGALDAAGFGATGIIVMDGGYDADEVTTAAANASYRAAVHGAGLHYPCNKPAPAVRELGWTFWASEDYSRDPAWANGGTYWGKALSQNYVLMNQVGGMRRRAAAAAGS